MAYSLIEQTEKERLYVNDKTGTTCATYLIYTDALDNRWFGFKDLFQIPYIRTAAAKKVSELFSTGITPEDLKTWIGKEKALLKSSDPEKYEKLYAMVLEKEALIENTVDVTKQHLSLCTVYVLAEDEKIDYYDPNQITKKTDIWRQDVDAVSFFLNWHYNNMASYIKAYTNTFQTVLKQPNNPS